MREGASYSVRAFFFFVRRLVPEAVQSSLVRTLFSSRMKFGEVDLGDITD